MEIKVRIYSCYELTYKEVYKKVLFLLYGKSIDLEDVILEIEDISQGGTLRIQKQRSIFEYVTRTIRVYENGIIKHIVGMSNTNYDLDKKQEYEMGLSIKNISSYGKNDYHANTYIKQGINKIFDYYFKNEETAILSFYLLDTDKPVNYPNNLFNVLSYRELETIGFKILNIDEIDFSEYQRHCGSAININSLSFSSFHKYMLDIAHISKRNTGNAPSFLQCNEYQVFNELGEYVYMTEKYIYTFKSLSAQGYDSLLRCWCMKILADKENTEIEFKLGKQYFAYDAEKRRVADKLTGPIKETFKNAGIEFEYYTDESFLNEKRNAENTYLKHKADNEIRNQPLFRNNIRKKGIPEECVLCNEDNPAILDAAHLWEVSVVKSATSSEINNFIVSNNLEEIIDQNSEYKNEIFFKKYSLVNSGDNGVWLCKNHHKLFDDNYYCFDSNNGKILFHFEDSEEALEFSKQFENVELDSKILSSATKVFLRQRQIILL